ncbi:FtsX-like permease family protein [uncultured Rothia sp.]|uniref:FtsX-like permease family protein n=1 Tax=uncultured Rothia sp. TaxID=316088 RepID=UPI003217AA63
MKPSTTLTTVALRQVMNEKRKLALTGLGIFLSVFFLTAIFILQQTSTATMRAQFAGLYQHTDAVVEAPAAHTQRDADGNFQLTRQQVKEISELPGIEGTWAIRQIFDVASLPGGQNALVQRTNFPDDQDLFPWEIEGRAPQSASEVLVTSDFSKAHGLSTGQMLSLVPVGSSSSTQHDDLKIVGVVTSSSPTAAPQEETIFEGGHELAENLESASNSPGSSGEDSVLSSVSKVLVKSSIPHAAPSSLKKWAAEQVFPAQPVVSTVVEQVDQETLNTTEGVNVQLYILLIFGAIALMMSAFVISNTFDALTLQRSRQLALLRTIGASQGSLLGMLLLESLLIGVVFSVLGVLATFALAMVLQTFLESWVIPLSVRPAVIGLSVGVSMTLLSGLRPALKYFRISPMSMFSNVSGAQKEKATTRLTAIVGGLLLCAGTALSIFATAQEISLLVVLGCALLGLSLLLLFPLPLVGILSIIPSGSSRVSQLSLAKTTAARSAHRTASTGRMVFISTMIIGAVLMGYSSLKASVNYGLENWSPVSLQASLAPEGSQQAPDSAQLHGMVQKIEEQESVESAQVIKPVAELTADSNNPGLPRIIYSVEAARLSETVPALKDTPLVKDELLVGSGMAESWGLSDGQQVTLAGVPGSAQLTVQVVEANLTQPLVADTTAAELNLAERRSPAVAETPGEMYIHTRANLSSQELSETLTQTAEILNTDAKTLHGGAIDRADFDQQLAVVLTVIMVLLAASILISVVGISNSLTLSAIQRERENAILRALGLSRTRLRQLICWEALMISATAAILGIIGGATICAIGLQILAAEQLTVVYDVPWLSFLLLLLVTLALTWGAAALPAHRASKTPPVRALHNSQ